MTLFPHHSADRSACNQTGSVIVGSVPIWQPDELTNGRPHSTVQGIRNGEAYGYGHRIVVIQDCHVSLDFRLTSRGVDLSSTYQNRFLVELGVMNCNLICNLSTLISHLGT